MNRSELHFVQGSGINVGRRQKRHGIGQTSIRCRARLNEMALLFHIQCVIYSTEAGNFSSGAQHFPSRCVQLHRLYNDFYPQHFANPITKRPRNLENFSPSCCLLSVFHQDYNLTLNCLFWCCVSVRCPPSSILNTQCPWMIFHQ